MKAVDLIKVKLERADQHIEDLVSDCKAFDDSSPCKIAYRRNSGSGDLTVSVERVKEVPIAISTITGDAIQNLRSALDHLAYQLVIAAGAKPTKQTGFPISESEAKYGDEKSKKVEGMHQTAIDAIDCIKPYKGEYKIIGTKRLWIPGNETLWKLHSLNNIDKHRLLLPVASMNRLHPMTKSQSDGIFTDFLGVDPSETVPSGFMTQPPIRYCPLEAGKVLMVIPASERQDDLRFEFTIAINEPTIVDGEPLVDLVRHMRGLVHNYVGILSKFL